VAEVIGRSEDLLMRSARAHARSRGPRATRRARERAPQRLDDHVAS
jgi:hypothetical protein